MHESISIPLAKSNGYWVVDLFFWLKKRKGIGVVELRTPIDKKKEKN